MHGRWGRARLVCQYDPGMVNVGFRTLGGAQVVLGIEAGVWTLPTDAPIIDLTELYAVRGLVDAHAHLSADSLADATSAGPGSRSVGDRAWSQLASGVFLLFDKGAGDRAHLSVLSEPPDRRPEMQMAGTILYPPGGYYPGVSTCEVDVADLGGLIAEEAAAPATWVKLVGDWPRPGQGAVPNFTVEQMAEVVHIAHAAGCRVAIHAAGPLTSSMAVEAGVDSIEHGLFLTEDDLVTLGARGGAWVPTLLAMAGVRDSLRTGSSGWTLFDEGITNAARLLPAAVEAGVTVLAGTDLTVPHGGVAREAIALAEAGLAAADVVHSLTDAGYGYARLGEPFSVGSPADLVGFAADPRERVSALAVPTVVMRRGHLLADRR